MSLPFTGWLGEEGIKKRSGHLKSVNPSSGMTAVGLHSCFTATLSKLVKVAVAGIPGLGRVMISYCTKLLKGLSHLSPSGEPSLFQYRGIYPLWPTVKLPLKPVLIQACFSLWWLQSQWGKHWWYDKLATCIFYILLKKSGVFYICVLLLLLGELSFETSQLLTLYSFSCSSLKASHTVAGFPLMRHAGESFIGSLPQSMIWGRMILWSQVQHACVPPLCGGRVVSSEGGRALLSCGPWWALWCNGFLVGSLCSVCHPGMFCRTAVFSSCQDSKSPPFLSAIEQEFSPTQNNSWHPVVGEIKTCEHTGW